MGILLKSFFLIVGVLSVMGDDAFDQEKNWKEAKSVHDFHVNDIEGKDTSMDKYKDYVLIIVNVASKCGLTDTNYKQLQALYEKYQSKGLRIAAFPSGDFMNQEFDDPKDILEFIKKFNVSFDMYEKVHVNGDEAHPLWKYLQTKPEGSTVDKIKWNFTKFVVDKNGQVVARFEPTVEPDQMEETLLTYL